MARFTQNAGGTGTQLNYAQVAGPQVTVTSAPSTVIELGMITTGKPVQISVTGEAANDTAATWLRINLFRDGNAIGNEMQLEASATSENVSYAINFIDDVSAGTYVYSLRVVSMTGGSWQFGEVAGPVMNAVELTGFKGDPGTGSSADIADFIFTNNGGNSSITLPGNKEISIISGVEEDLYITAGDDLYLQTIDDDIFLQANDDIRFIANWNNGGIEQNWIMNSEGQFQLPGDGYISNPSNSSGDGYGNDTLHLVPDSDLTFEGGDQYIIIDPTAPNHIHLRAGGVQDASFADLFLGAERTNVHVSDNTGDVQITSKRDDLINSYVNLNTDSNQYFITSTESIVGPDGVVNVDGLDYAVLNVQFDAPEVGLQTLEISGGNFTAGNNYTFRVADGENYWTFDSNGVLYGPSVGSVKLAGITGEPGNNTFYISADQNLILQSGGDLYGEYLNNSNDGLNQIATIREIAAVTEELTPVETSFTVNGGTTATQPTFDGAPLFSGTYVKIGPQVHFQIQVDMDNITSFGTGQYYVDLPFDAKYGYQFKEGCLHHTATSNQYAIGGHVAAGTNRLFLTYTGSNGQDEMFDHNSPVTLAVTDNFHVAGTYIAN